MLIGLLLPAVQKVREAAARMQCANNLKQVGLACHHYYDVLGILPTGGEHFTSGRQLIDGAPTSGAGQTWGWAYQILPYLEQKDLWANPDNAFVERTPVKTYSCPSRRPPTVYGGGALMDYGGCGGITGEYGPVHEGMIVGISARLTNQAIGLHDVTDGLSNTLLVGEKCAMSNMYRGGACGDNTGYFSGTGWDEMRWARAQPRQDFQGSDCSGDNASEDRFGSAHPAGFHCVLGDGSVRSIRFAVPLEILQRAASRFDGQAYSPDEL